MSTAAGAINLAPTNWTRFPLGNLDTVSVSGNGLTVGAWFLCSGSVTWLQMATSVTVNTVMVTRNMMANVFMLILRDSVM